MTDDFPYTADGVKQGDFSEQYRFPIVTTSHPAWAYITAVVVADDDGWPEAVRPTDDELRVVGSFHREYCDYWYDPSGCGWRGRVMEKRPFDIDGGANGRILIKRAEGDWAYRLRSWSIGPMFKPSLSSGGPKLDLYALLDYIHGGRDGQEVSSRWTKWKAAHPEVFRV